jgi:hypothetical protein
MFKGYLLEEDYTILLSFYLAPTSSLWLAKTNFATEKKDLEKGKRGAVIAEVGTGEV